MRDKLNSQNELPSGTVHLWKSRNMGSKGYIHCTCRRNLRKWKYRFTSISETQDSILASRDSILASQNSKQSSFEMRGSSLEFRASSVNLLLSGTVEISVQRKWKRKEIFAVGLVNSVLNLPDGQVILWGGIQTQKNCNQSCSSNFFGLVEMTFRLVHDSHSLPFGQAVKLTFFAPWKFIHCWPFVLTFPGHCSPNLVFILLSDVFDCITLEECDPLFSFVEERVSTWTMVSHYLTQVKCYHAITLCLLDTSDQLLYTPHSWEASKRGQHVF